MIKDNSYRVKQNKNLIKTSNYYYIDYQYIVKDPKDGEQYYGRTNRLKFKLCHDYCETCYELGTSDNDQKCLSCLSEYQYDYFYFTQKNNNNELLNCVPEKYYNNGNNLAQCDEENTKHYFNLTNNKTIYVLIPITIAQFHTQFITKQQKNVFIVILNVLIKENVILINLMQQMKIFMKE